jgi:hypothetical protein
MTDESTLDESTLDESKFATKLKAQSPGRLIGASILVLVVGLIAGFGIGFKVEQGRVKSAKKARVVVVKRRAPVPASVRMSGKVTAHLPAAVTIVDSKGLSHRFAMLRATRVVNATAGTLADIVPGSRVIFKNKAGGFTTAEEVVVLPTNAKFGVLVKSATAESMTIQGPKTTVSINIKGAKVDKAAPSTPAAVTSGRTVFVVARRIKSGALIALGIVVLPATTTYS